MLYLIFYCFYKKCCPLESICDSGLLVWYVLVIIMMHLICVQQFTVYTYFFILTIIRLGKIKSPLFYWQGNRDSEKVSQYLKT